MDAGTPGVQTAITVPPGTTRVSGVAITLRDPLGTRELWAIGYIGGIDRGLAFGHVPYSANAGTVTGITPFPGLPANPQSTIWFATEPGIDKGFPGPEVQYLEAGAGTPAPIPAAPAAPLFTVDVTLASASPGDVYAFHLLDYVSVWRGGTGEYGAFSTQMPLSLDTGGDVGPDSTVTLHGIDPDLPVPVPPAAFAVDLIDGGATPGPATITIGSNTGAGNGPSAAHQRFRLDPPAPNPARGAQAIRLELAEPLAFELAVHDAAGHLVRILAARAMFSPGRHVFPFDGRDGAGRPLAAGVYFVTLAAEGARETARIVLLP
jgi:hypothetical protein